MPVQKESALEVTLEVEVVVKGDGGEQGRKGRYMGKWKGRIFAF